MDRIAFGAELRRRRDEQHLKLRDLADITFLSKTSLWEWERGDKLPSKEVVQLLDGQLHAGGVLIKLHKLVADAERHRELSRESSRLCGRLAALSAGEMVSLVSEDTHRLALDYLTRRGTELTDEVTAARRAALGNLRKRRLRGPDQVKQLAADIGYHSGILAYAALDGGDPQAALVHASAAWQAAELAGSDQLRAWVRGTESLILRFMQRFPEALAHAEDGLRYAGSGTARARLLAGVGQCQANLGDARAARLALSSAESAFDGQRGTDQVGGLFGFSRAKLHYYSGSALIWLEGSADARRAIVGAHVAIHMWERAGPERSIADEALAHIYAATAALQLGQLEEAAADLMPILALPPERRISWIVKRMGRITAMLSGPPFVGERMAADLLDQIRDYR